MPAGLDTCLGTMESFSVIISVSPSFLFSLTETVSIEVDYIKSISLKRRLGLAGAQGPWNPSQ